MAWGVNSVLNMGVGALFASQANIQTTGNNISNVNTTGYSRQVVRQEAQSSVNGRAGQIGQGVVTTEVIRYYDAFLEANYVDKLGLSQRYESQYSQLRYVDNIFNEANLDGLSATLTEMFLAWNKLAQSPADMPTREALLSSAGTLINQINSKAQSLKQMEDQVNAMIRQDVTTANQLMQDIAAINREIAANYSAGRNNPNELMDKRDLLVRELGGIVDVVVEDGGPGHYSLRMKNGCTLVQNDIPFSLQMTGPSVENNLTATSPYKAKNADGSQKSLQFSGTDSYEYTVEIVDGGGIGGGASFRVSIDGGKSWLTDDSGNVRTFDANEEGGSVRVGELDIWFDAGSVATGDRFVISPKNDVYWVSPTSGPINISPQILSDGSENSMRLTGGSLAGLLEFRDYQLGEYQDRLNAFSQSLIWEVNRIHSQGAGLTPMTSALGTYSVGRTNVPLGSPESLFTWSDRLQSGNMTFTIFDAEGNSLVPYPGISVFSPENFDPEKHSLEDIVAAINSASFVDANGATVRPFTASIVNGQVQIASTDPDQYGFAVTGDTSGVLAALGINTFFSGDSAETIGLRPDLTTNLNLINAGQVNIPGEINAGDNTIANMLYELASKGVDIGTIWNKKTNQSLSSYYSTLVTKVGSDTQSTLYTAANQTAMALDLYQRSEEISGVSLDEEMSTLIKFQASYKAAAKLITTADEMLQTVLGLKQ